MKRLIFFYIMALPSALLCQNEFDRMVDKLISENVPVLSVETLNKKIEAEQHIVLLDARENEEYRVSHLIGARHCGYEHFNAEAVKGVNKAAPIVVYCSVGYRSDKIASKLQTMGFTDVRNLYGGIFDWVNKGYPVYNKNGETNQIHGYDQKWGKWLMRGEKVFK